MGFSGGDVSALAGMLREAAATEIMPRFRRLGVGGVRTKSGPLDLVTDADEAAEARITRALEMAFPGVLVVGEEAAAHDLSLIARLAAAPLACGAAWQAAADWQSAIPSRPTTGA